MASSNYIKNNIRLIQYVDDLAPMFCRLPPIRSKKFAITALLFDDNILNRRTDVGEAPRDPLVVPYDHVRHTGQRNASHIEFAEAQVGFVPKIRNLMPQMHVVRQ